MSRPLMPKTNAMKQKEIHLAKQARLKALQWLAEKFPEAFNNQLRIRPLKIGIMEDILGFAEEALAAGISKSKLREAVVLFTRRIDYLTCLKAKEHRVDLSGQMGEPVTDEEAAQAAQKIKRLLEKKAKRSQTTPTHKEFKSPSSRTPSKAKPAIIIKRKIQVPTEVSVIDKLKNKLDIPNADVVD